MSLWYKWHLFGKMTQQYLVSKDLLRLIWAFEVSTDSAEVCGDWASVMQQTCKSALDFPAPTGSLQVLNPEGTNQQTQSTTIALQLQHEGGERVWLSPSTQHPPVSTQIDAGEKSWDIPERRSVPWEQSVAAQSTESCSGAKPQIANGASHTVTYQTVHTIRPQGWPIGQTPRRVSKAEEHAQARQWLEERERENPGPQPLGLPARSRKTHQHHPRRSEPPKSIATTT